MSNSELLLTAYEAWNRDDCEAWLELLDPEIEISTSGVFPDFAPTYRGRPEAAKFWRRLREPFDEFRIEVERIEDEGDCAVAAIRFCARGADSGVEVDMRFANGIRVRDSLATQLVNRRTVEEAREALRQIRPAERSRKSSDDRYTESSGSVSARTRSNVRDAR
jgi:ketosteroid isomerase-like protein